MPAPIRYIAVEVGGSHYGLGVDEVQEVVEMRPLTRVFHAPALLSGLANLRGDVLPVLDLAEILGEARGAGATEASIVVVRERDGQRRRAGLKVDALAGLREEPPGGLLPLPPAVAGRLGSLALGVIPESPPCVVLSVSAVFGSPLLADLTGGSPA